MSRNVHPRALPSLAIIGLLGLAIVAHRLLLWQIFGSRIDAVAVANPTWLTWQYLTLSAYTDHLAPALWYLQQTPPLPHIVFGIVAKLAAWPIGVARWLYLFQASLSIVTVGLLFLVLRRLGCGLAFGLAACLWFALSSDLYVMEINSLGQLFYENGAMPLALGACYCLAEAHRRRNDTGRASLRLVLSAGGLVALCALTRASFSLFALPTVGFATVCLGWRRALIMLVPIVLLHGGWSLKNAVVYGYLSPNTSSWAGINATVSMDDDLKADFVRSIEDGSVNIAPWVVRLLRDNGYVSWSPPIPPEVLPADVAARERQIQEALGGSNTPENSVGLQRLSAEYLKAMKPFAFRHLGALLHKLGEGYTVFWQPIANYSSMFLGPVSTVAQEHDLWSRAPFSLVRPAQVMTGTFPDVSEAAVVLPALSLDILDAVCFWTLHLLLPLLLLHDGIMAILGGRRLVTAEMLLLALVIVYGGVLFNAVELGENMRFRLSIEPEIIALSASLLVAALSLLRRGVASLRPSLVARQPEGSGGQAGPIAGRRAPARIS